MCDLKAGSSSPTWPSSASIASINFLSSSPPTITQNAEDEQGVSPPLIPLSPSRSASPSHQTPALATIIGDGEQSPASGEDGEKGKDFFASKTQQASSGGAAETQLLLWRWPKNTLFQRVPLPSQQQQQWPLHHQQQQLWSPFVQEVRESYTTLYDLVAVLVVVLVLVYIDPAPPTSLTPNSGEESGARMGANSAPVKNSHIF